MADCSRQEPTKIHRSANDETVVEHPDAASVGEPRRSNTYRTETPALPKVAAFSVAIVRAQRTPGQLTTAAAYEGRDHPMHGQLEASPICRAMLPALPCVYRLLTKTQVRKHLRASL